ncbi:MAG: hypothetical protein KC684_09040, partial [Candidatus Omnitrophica bacterium]|nr:hypothetical protein [Candidatus Omnitrophota bacterium]
MKRALVIISGVYLLIFGLWMFFMCVAMFSFSSISSGQLPEEQAKMIPFIGILFYGPLGIGLIATAVGLFLNKNWARIVTIILSSVALILGILGLISIGLIHSMGETADPAMDASNIRMIGIIIYGIFLVLIPAFFLILFNSRAVNILFLGIEDNSEDVQRLIEEKKKNPIGIKLVATYYCIMLLGGGFVFFQPNNQEIPVIGDFLWLSGTPLKIYQLSMAFIFFSVGIGFKKKKKWAW